MLTENAQSRNAPHTLSASKCSPKKEHYINKYYAWEVSGADIFMINSRTLLYIIGYYSAFSIVKKVNSLSASNLEQTAKLNFCRMLTSKQIVSDVGINFMAEKFKAFCRRMNIQQTIISSYHH